jgi:hypothetical protein
MVDNGRRELARRLNRIFLAQIVEEPKDTTIREANAAVSALARLRCNPGHVQGDSEAGPCRGCIETVRYRWVADVLPNERRLIRAWLYWTGR